MTLSYRPNSNADVVKLFVLETDEPHPDTQTERGSFGEIVFHHFYRAGMDHHPPLGVEVSQQFIVTEKGGTMPTYADLEPYDGILITGSVYDAHGEDPWILQLLDLLKELWTRRPDFHFTGVCFGHQIIARLLGAEVRPAPSGDWELGHCAIDLKPVGQRLFRTRDDKIYLHQMHQDQVVAPPTPEKSGGLLSEDGPRVEVWGSSPHTAVQGLYCENRLFTSQAHLAFDEAMVRRQIQMRVEAGSIQDWEHADRAAETGHLEHDGRAVAAAIMRLFHYDDDGMP
ncbi:class I glutamine amidotransferase-like protein [Sodiomyces alkalinus F11]|uniref:Class I glutamine amidotransferase-like protein n=1 Tax=Sodiomyces alkalinus (strain CBS 110278 / VKM F-3762 / F11) TaxID=1314773 RepID=A0A3N2PNT0_SODAK|nr:class I glutamine amidotransferase-like protein [Sodiomyces alkalinus F11]ROT36175.1 class I glutamine amidotransferase-like protein [Sodiomyces alkalinus F11]